MNDNKKRKELRAVMISELQKNNIKAIGNKNLTQLKTHKLHSWYRKLGMKMKLIEKFKYVNYEEYLLSPEWKEFRKIAIKQVNGKCQNCSSNEKLQIHHIHYRTLGKEQMSDVNVLCGTCHLKLHEIGKQDYRYLRMNKYK